MIDIKKSLYSFAFDKEVTGISLLSQEESNLFWHEYIDDKKENYFKFEESNWIIKSKKKIIDNDYTDDFNNEIKENIISKFNFVEWLDLDCVYFCLNKNTIIVTSWTIFKENWIEFLYIESDCSFLINIENNKKESLIFTNLGQIQFVPSTDMFLER